MGSIAGSKGGIHIKIASKKLKTGNGSKTMPANSNG